MNRVTIDAYRHPDAAGPALAQQPDPAPGFYYVSVRDGGRTGLLAGPYVNDHAGALADVQRVRRIAEELNSRAVWYSFGTCRTAADAGPGKLNGLLQQAKERDRATDATPAAQAPADARVPRLRKDRRRPPGRGAV